MNNNTYSIADILAKPTVVDRVHESMYRSYTTLEYVLAMVQRGDSKETIAEIATLLQDKDWSQHQRRLERDKKFIDFYSVLVGRKHEDFTDTDKSNIKAVTDIYNP